METILNIDELRDEIDRIENDLWLRFQKAETAEEHAEICRIESEELAWLKADLQREIEANGQFGVGA